MTDPQPQPDALPDADAPDGAIEQVTTSDAPSTGTDIDDLSIDDGDVDASR